MKYQLDRTAKVGLSSLMAVVLAAWMLAGCSKEAIVTPAPKANTATVAAPTEKSEGSVKFTADSFSTQGLSIEEGKDYKKLKHPQPVAVPGKPEVAEFFWYGCGHCYAVEPVVRAWSQFKPADVRLVRYHAQWNGAMKSHQRMAMAVRVLNKSNELDAKIFEEIQQGGNSLTSDDAIAAFMVKNGVDRAVWDAAFKGFETNALIVTSDSLFKSYELDGVPKFVVNGKYLVEGTGAQSFKVINKLLEQAP